MSSGLIAFFLAAGSTTWLFNKLQRSSGGDTRQSVVAAGVVGGIIFMVAFTLLKFGL